MALRAISRVKLPAKKPEAPKILTIQQARELHPIGSMERAAAELAYFSEVKDEAREAMNAQNRQQTQAGKALKQMIAEGTIDYGDEIRLNAFAYKFDYARADIVNTRQLYEMVVSGKVPLDHFLKCVSVQKDMATKVIGAHIINPITFEEVGNKADIRVTKLDNPVGGLQFIKKPPAPASKKKLIRDTDRAPVDNFINASRIRPRRRLNVGA